MAVVNILTNEDKEQNYKAAPVIIMLMLLVY